MWSLSMSKEIIRKANQAMISGKQLSSYDIPERVKSSIANKKYTRDQINEAYAKALKMG